MTLDIDYFKLVNDVHGHQIGDYALKNIAKIISINIRKLDIFGGYGGEEFVIICLNTRSFDVYNGTVQKSVSTW